MPLSEEPAVIHDQAGRFADPNAVRVPGGAGYIQGFEVERGSRDARITQIREGTNQRNIILRELLRS